MKLIRLSVLAFLCLAVPLAAQERKGDTVTFKLRHNLIFVDVTVNGEGPFEFIYDTGASVTVIKSSTARKLGLKLEDVPGTGEGMLGGLLKWAGLTPRVTRVRSIALGEAGLDGFEAVVMDVPQADIPPALTGTKYYGIVGYHFISRFVTTLDYQKKTIRLVPNDFNPGPTFPQLAAAKGPEARPHLGFSYRTIGDDAANEVGVEGGVVVGTLQKDGPAQRAGLKKGDIILRLDGARIRTADNYRAACSRLRPGRTAKLLILRERKEQTLEIKVGRRP